MPTVESLPAIAPRPALGDPGAPLDVSQEFWSNDPANCSHLEDSILRFMQSCNDELFARLDHRLEHVKHEIVTGLGARLCFQGSQPASEASRTAPMDIPAATSRGLELDLAATATHTPNGASGNNFSAKELEAAPTHAQGVGPCRHVEDVATEIGQEVSSMMSMMSGASLATNGTCRDSMRSSQIDFEAHDTRREIEAERHAQQEEDDEDSLEPENGRTWLQRQVQDTRFESFFGIAIVTNAIFIGIQTNYVAVNLTETPPPEFKVVNIVYTCLFSVELLIKLIIEGKRFFCDPEHYLWNLLDIFIVATSVVEVVTASILSASENDASSTSQFRILRIMRITRLIRVLRATRVIRVIRALRTLVHQIMSTLKSLVWAVILLVLVMFLFAIIFTNGVTGHRMQAEETQSVDVLDFENELLDPLYRYWATVPRSMFTLLKAICGGISWEEVVHPLSDVDPTTVGLFIIYILFAELAVLNVITGVFCQNAIDSAQHDKDLVTQSILANKKKYIQQIHKIFNDIDVDNSGTITIQEFKKHLNNVNVKAYFESLELDTSDVWSLFRMMDTDAGNAIDLDEFVAGCFRLKGFAKGLDMAKLMYEHKWLANKLGRFMRRTENLLQLVGDAMVNAGLVQPSVLTKVGSNIAPLA